MSSMYGATGGGSGSKIPKGYKEGRLQQFTPEMMQLFQQMFGHVGKDSYLSRLASGDQSLFEEIERPALQQFSGIQGGIASKYSGAGLGARRSSGFQNEMTAAGSQFAQDLQAKRQGLQRDAIKDLTGISRDLLSQRPYENYLIKEDPKKSFLEKIFGQGIFGGGGENMANVLKIISLFM